MSDMTDGIRLAEKADIPALCAIWHACFFDSEEYIHYFYRENFERMHIYVYVAGTKPVSMVHLMQAALADGDRKQDVKYIYAAGTHPRHRNKGYMSALLAYVTAQAKQNAYALFLKPSSWEITAFYKKFGFEPDGAWHLHTIQPGEKQALSVSPLSAEEYNRMRDAAFGKRAYVKWQDAHVRWCVAENAYFSGKTLAVHLGGEEYFLMGAPEADTFFITETNLSLEQLHSLSAAVCEMFGTACMKLYLPAPCVEDEKSIPSSIVYNATIHHAYINLILL
ncbi:MAG: GNAT family N-acetyltransferase [Clostridia bacterium]|nr:GNAT family N-acetyltransferase [Clostridia bacterium]